VSAIYDALEPHYRAVQAREIYIVRRRERNCYMAALAATYGCDGAMALPVVQAQVNRVHQQFVARLWELCHHGKYFPISGVIPDPHYFDADRLARAFNLCANCRSVCVIYPPRVQQTHKFKSCGRTNFCPACWSGVAARQFQQFRQLINAVVRTDATQPLEAVHHVIETFVPAPANLLYTEHTPVQDILAAVPCLTRTLARYKNWASSLRTRTFRNALAAYWRLLVLPGSRGWRVQYRRLYVVPVGTRLRRRLLLRGAHNVSQNIAPIPVGLPWADRKGVSEADDALNSLMVEFSQYPRELLTEDLDLTAAALHATNGERLVGGFGKFRSASSSLVRRARNHDKRVKKHVRTAAKKR
jgi:hypothetical protein